MLQKVLHMISVGKNLSNIFQVALLQYFFPPSISTALAACYNAYCMLSQIPETSLVVLRAQRTQDCALNYVPHERELFPSPYVDTAF